MAGVTVTANVSRTLTVSTLYPYTTLFRSSLNYTATSEFEGSDTLHVTATSTDGAALPSAASARSEERRVGNEGSDRRSVSVQVNTTVLDESTAQQISRSSATPATGDAGDP